MTAAILDASEASGTDTSADSGQQSGEHVLLSSIRAVAAHLSFVDAARARVTSDMEAMVITGLATLVRTVHSP